MVDDIDMTLITRDYFALFGLAIDYEVNKTQLNTKLHEVQQHFHPDKFVDQELDVRDQILQISSHINHAYNTLINPLLRAIYLLELNGIKLNLAHETKFSHEFLLEQISLREAIEDAQIARDLDQLEVLELEIKCKVQQLADALRDNFIGRDYTQVTELIKQLAFYDKLLTTLNNLIGEL